MKFAGFSFIIFTQQNNKNDCVVRSVHSRMDKGNSFLFSTMRLLVDQND